MKKRGPLSVWLQLVITYLVYHKSNTDLMYPRQLAKLSLNHSIGRTHIWRFFQFFIINNWKKWKYTPAVRTKISSKLIFASCVWYSDRAHYELCVLIKDIGRRLPLQLQCYNYSVAIRVNRMILVSLCAETIKPVSEGDKIWQLWYYSILS